MKSKDAIAEGGDGLAQQAAGMQIEARPGIHFQSSQTTRSVWCFGGEEFLAKDGQMKGAGCQVSAGDSFTGKATLQLAEVVG